MKNLALSLLSLLLLSAVLFSCKKENTHTVKYTIQGTSKSNVTYTDGNGNTQTVSNVDANWTTEFTSDHHGLVLNLMVTSTNGSPVGGKIYIDGQQATQDNGSNATINISATLP